MLAIYRGDAINTSGRRYTWLPILMVAMAVVALTIGAITLQYLQSHLIATMGKTLAVTAADIADKLDRILYERYNHIQTIAQAPPMQSLDVKSIDLYLDEVKKNYPLYEWLGVTDTRGKILAATDARTKGKDWSQRPWFRAVQQKGIVDVQDAQIVMESHGMAVVVFSAPITDPHHRFQGVVTAMVKLPVMEDVFASTIRAFQLQWGSSGPLEWQFLTRDGDLIADSILRQEGKVNLKQLGLVSALFTGSAEPGYVEEKHLRRHVAVVSGYAQTQGYGTFTGLHWGILIRMDRSAILAPIKVVLLKLMLAGVFIFMPMLTFLIWTTGRLRRAWIHSQEREEWLSTVLKSIGDAVIATDDKPAITFMNPIAESLTGWSQKDAKGQPLDKIFQIINEVDRQRVETPVAKVFREGVIVGLANHTILIAKDGKERPIDDSAAPIRDDSGKILGVILVFRDISGRKEAEAALWKSEEQLSQFQKMEAVGQLTGGVAHDINNLLVPILGYSDYQVGHLDPAHPLRTSAVEIKKAAERAATLIRQLMAFSRKQVLEPRVLDLNNVMSNLKPMLQRLIGEDIDLVFQSHLPLGYVYADPIQMEQVIMNLAVNARDAMAHGGRLTIEAMNAELKKDSIHRDMDLRPGSYVMLAISDSGHGISKEIQAHLFEPFFTTKENGTGLGLATVYGIVKQSKGHIFVCSEPGQGATFKIYLPRVQGALLKEYVNSGESKQLPLGSETILLVEDEDSVREFIQDALQKRGYTILTARHSADAFLISGHHEGQIPLMITDVVMPGMSGFDLAERLRSSRPYMKVLYISGYADGRLLRYGAGFERAAFLQKPFTVDILVRKIQTLLSAQLPPAGIDNKFSGTPYA